MRFPRRRLSTWEVRVHLSGRVSAARIEGVLAPNCHRVWLVGLSQDDGTSMTLGIEAPRQFDLDAATAALRAEGAESVQWESAGQLEE